MVHVKCHLNGIIVDENSETKSFLINGGAEMVWFSVFGQDARILPEIRLYIIRS